MQIQPIRPLLLALAVAMAPLVFHLPWWAVGWCMLSWGYLLVGNGRGWPTASRGVRLVLFIVGMAAVLIFAGLQFDGGDFIALLAVMAGIKPLEIQSRRDSMVTGFLAYFLTITSLFVFENLAMTLYLFVSVWITTGVLIHVNDSTGTIGRQLRLSARLIMLAVPLMVLLFFLFPRLSGSFWGSPWARQTRSGFSSRMHMGDVSRLVLVDEPAFTVTFDAGVPDADRLYWRGIVFKRFDGIAWHPGDRQDTRQGSVGGTDLARYKVVLEPHGHRHLFVLDLPVAANPVATIMDDHTLMARRPVWKRFHYDAASFVDTLQTAADPPGRAYLQLPANRNPRAVALGKRWARVHADPKAAITAALTFFKTNAFQYTLQPSRSGIHVVDDFIFVNRKGFCEHFATAFTVLMRAAGVPTRIVGGYQGGRWNTIGEFLTVRHSDAHVWCEVWQDGQGWVRVDPTFAVAPDRIDAGIDSALAGERRLWFLGRGQGDTLAYLLGVVRQTWEAVNTRWNIWFMGFSAEDQRALLQRLGIFVGRQAGWLLVLILPASFFCGWILLGCMRHNKQSQSFEDRVLKIYGRFLDKMARAGIPKASHRGPLDYGRWVADRYPALERDVLAIIGSYIGLRYGFDRNLNALRVFRGRVRRFNPQQAGAPGSGGVGTQTDYQMPETA